MVERLAETVEPSRAAACFSPTRVNAVLSFMQEHRAAGLVRWLFVIVATLLGVVAIRSLIRAERSGRGGTPSR